MPLCHLCSAKAQTECSSFDLLLNLTVFILNAGISGVSTRFFSTRSAMAVELHKNYSRYL